MSSAKKRNSGDSSRLPVAWRPETVATLQSEAAAFDAVKLRTDRYPIDPNFRWATMKNEILKPQDMATPHLWNSLKMLWNHTVPVPLRLMPYKPYDDKAKVFRSQKMRQWAIANLFNELMNRNDRPKYINDGLSTMAEHLASNKTLLCEKQKPEEGQAALEENADRKL